MDMIRDDSGNVPLASNDTTRHLEGGHEHEVPDPDARDPEAPDAVAPGPTVPDYSPLRRKFVRLVFFLGLHLLMNLAELSAMTLFVYLQCYGMLTLLLLPWTASGILCALAACEAKTPKLDRLVGRCSVLPLSERRCIVGVLLAIPFGFFQGVIVVLELEDFLEYVTSFRQGRDRNSAGVAEEWITIEYSDCYREEIYARFGRAVQDDDVVKLAVDGERMMTFGQLASCTGEELRRQFPIKIKKCPPQEMLGKFHCKAINGALEGLFATTIVYFGYFGLGFPSYNPILQIPSDDFAMYKMFLRLILIVTSVSTGLCLLEIDFAVSNIKRGLKDEALHCLFRTSEVVSRVTLFVLFAVLTFSYSHFWWVPLVVDVLLVFMLTDAYGGCENTVIIRLICMVPCAFANVFFFIDSPTKRRNARRLTVAFAYKNVFEMVALPILCFFCAPDHILSDFKSLFHNDPFSTFVAILTHPVYWGLFHFMYNRHRPDSEEKDIFTACEEGDVDCVRKHMLAEIDVDTYDTNGMTPLMLVVQKCRKDLDETSQQKYCEISGILINQGACIDRPIFDDGRYFWTFVQMPHRLRWTALHMAAYGGSPMIVKALLDEHRIKGATTSNAEENFKDANGDTPLHIAVRNKHTEIAKEIVSVWNWARENNKKQQKPIDNDIATDGMRQAILDTIDEINEPLRSIQPSSQFVRLPITRSFIERPCHSPGLCSFIASSGGGTLGKVFLKTVPEDESFQDTASLTTQDNPSLSSNPNEVPEQVVKVLPENIVPVDESGNPCRLWETLYGNKPFDVSSFTIIRRTSVAFLGEGAFGSVWRGKDRITGKLLAIKNMESHRAQCQREMSMAKTILLSPHPCVVGFHAVCNYPDNALTPGLTLLVMELCTGGNMQAIIYRRRQECGTTYSPPGTAWRMIGQIFLALEHLHLKMEILYRDMKPDNVVLSGDGVAKLTDFGYGRQGTQSRGTWTFACPTGSPGFTAPEVFLQNKIDVTCDLYSYGVLIWMLLTGGLKRPQTPRPPRAPGNAPFSAYTNDWKDLKKCIEKPAENDAVPLPSGSPKDLVSKLIENEPRRRPKHPEIRSKACIQELQLPAFGSSNAEVKAWLERNF